MKGLSPKQKVTIYILCYFGGGVIAGFILSFFSAFISLLFGDSISRGDRLAEIIIGASLLGGITTGLFLGSYIWQPWKVAIPAMVISCAIYPVALFLRK